jgi:hypothetical protein|tara:strand:+ start:463 stop:1017 length:555 start_codon:yes stop_codon:yes gene_type:complete
MSIQIYKPNKSNNGFAFSFYIGEPYNNKNPNLFLNAIAQHSWDSNKRIGSFSGSKTDPDKNISIKFNEFECGAIISAINCRHEWSTYHAFEENKTQIKLSPWDKKVTSTRINSKTKEAYEETSVIPAFGVSIVRNGNQTFKIPLEPGEAQCLKILCETLIRRICEKPHYKPQKKSAPKDNDYDF